MAWQGLGPGKSRGEEVRPAAVEPGQAGAGAERHREEERKAETAEQPAVERSLDED
jgi:hypothetical protein